MKLCAHKLERVFVGVLRERHNPNHGRDKVVRRAGHALPHRSSLGHTQSPRAHLHALQKQLEPLLVEYLAQ